MNRKYARARDCAWQWRGEATHIERERKELREALAELVDLKRLRMRLEAGGAFSPEESIAQQAHYNRRLPRAWRDAEQLLDRLPK